MDATLQAGKTLEIAASAWEKQGDEERARDTRARARSLTPSSVVGYLHPPPPGEPPGVSSTQFGLSVASGARSKVLRPPFEVVAKRHTSPSWADRGTVAVTVTLSVPGPLVLSASPSPGTGVLVASMAVSVSLSCTKSVWPMPVQLAVSRKIVTVAVAPSLL
jgi:hypothetical protein